MTDAKKTEILNFKPGRNVVREYVNRVRKLLTEELTPGQVDVVELEMRMLIDDMTPEQLREAIGAATEVLKNHYEGQG